MNKSVNINLSTLILIGIITFLLIGGGWTYYQNRVDNLKKELATETKLKNALLDSVEYYQNKEKEWVAEKLTIQTSVENLKNLNNKLTENQKELVKRIEEIGKDYKIIAAALIKTQVKVDSLLLRTKPTIDTLKKTVAFADTYKEGKKEMSFSFTIGNVLPAFKNIDPYLRIDSLSFPNKQFVNFNWKNDKKEGYPVSFSVSNSNDFFKTVNIDSYIIPEVNKSELKPNNWQKFGKFIKGSGKTLITIGVAGFAGWYIAK
jgi:hypothetical protein